MIEYENLNNLNKPLFEDYKIAFYEVFESGWYVIGKKVKEFEMQFSIFCNINYFVVLANSLDALNLSLRDFNFKKDIDLEDYFLKHDIKTQIHYSLAHNKQKAIIGILDNQSTPISEKINQTTLSLSISYFNRKENIQEVMDVINNF